MISHVSITRRAVVLAVVVLMCSTLAFAQGGGSSSRLSGTVTDSSGGVMPGVDVVAKNNSTNETYSAVTQADGKFTIPSMPPGAYTVTISLTGFKTVVLPDVVLVTNTPASVKTVLEVGQLEETVVVTGAAEVVQTQSAEVQTTVTIKQMNSLPVVSRTALDYVVSLPGVETAASNTRGSVVNGLPPSSMNITLDGVNVQDKRSNTEGFFMYIRPLMDSVEEISVSTSNPGAEASGSGASQIRMTTRSGTNRFTGSAYNTWRNQAGTSDEDVLTRKNHSSWLWGLNTPYWFNKRDLPKTAAGDYFINDIRLKTPGFRVGGPILKDKAFYFFNLEWFLLPDSRSRTRYLLSQQAQQGIFSYTANDGSAQSINLLTLAQAKGHVSTFDPSISKLLADIRQSTTKTGAVSRFDSNVDQYDFNVSATQKRYFPTLRLDYNLTAAHRLSFTGRYNDFNSTPDLLNNAEAFWPDFPNYGSQVSGRFMWQTTVRSTIGKNMVNEARVGRQDATGGGTYFGKGVDSSQFNCSGVGCQQAGGKGWYFGSSSGYIAQLSRNLTPAASYESSTSGVAAQWTVEDTLTWIRGKHSFTGGFSFAQIDTRNWAATPHEAYLEFGTSSVDPAYSMLDPTSGNFPGGITLTDANYARTLYGVLTGRVISYDGDAFLQADGTYKWQGERSYFATSRDIGLFFSDSWRVKPNLTLNLGARYELQMPMYATGGFPSQLDNWTMVYGVTGAGSGPLGQGNLYKPGTLTGTAPSLSKYNPGTKPYDTDWNNLSPSVGAAWRPAIKSKWLSAILSSDPVFRGGYSMTFTKFGTTFVTDSLGNLPGRSRNGLRNTSSGTPVIGASAVGAPAVYPVLLRDTARLFPSAYPASLSFPLTPGTTENVSTHFPTQNAPHTHQYSFGFQRALGKSMAIEARYVGNTNYGLYQTWNLNNNAQWSMLKGENGFYDEFRLAQQNLRANIAAGKGNTFAYTGAAGTAPLPIFMAFLQGIPLNDARNQDAANYVAPGGKNCTMGNANFDGRACFGASAWYNSLNMNNPAITTIAGTGSSGLQNDNLMANAKAAGLPVNFFMANPANKFGSANLRTTAGGSRYNAIQLDLRRQMAKGLLVQMGYAYSFARLASYQPSLRHDWIFDESTGGPDHSLKANWAYELPFGQGKTWGSSAGRWMEALIGGWEIDGVFRIQTGAKFNYGNFRLVGMSEQEFKDMFKFYHIPEVKADGSKVDRIYMLPEDVIKNSILAIYGTSATALSGYAGAAPTGKYLAPASSADCVQYLAGQCPGTKIARVVTGPKYAKLDMSFVKRFTLPKNMKIEARMDLYNVTNAINFNAIGPSSTSSTTGMGSSFTNWQVTSAASDLSAAQDPGGRVTQFGLRFIW